MSISRKCLGFNASLVQPELVVCTYKGGAQHVEWDQASLSLTIGGMCLSTVGTIGMCVMMTVIALMSSRLAHAAACVMHDDVIGVPLECVPL